MPKDIKVIKIKEDNAGFASRLISLVVAAVAILGLVTLVAASPSEAIAKTSNKTVKITMSAVGDCSLYTSFDGSTPISEFHNDYLRYGPDYFFAKVKHIFKNDDITVANLESVLSNSRAKVEKKYSFRGIPAYADIVKRSYIDVVSIANNHIFDYGNEGFVDTKKTLKAYKIPYCYKTTIAYKKIKGVKVAVIGLNGAEFDKFTKKDVKNCISRAKKKDAKIIIFNMHIGVDSRYFPTKKQRKLGRYAIDCGASVVLGHHPHVVQGIEKYKGRCIVYSLGNFIFANGNLKDKDSMIYQQTFVIKNGSLSKKLIAKVIPCSTSGEFFNNTHQPRILEDFDKRQVMSKIKALSKSLNTEVKTNGTVK